MTITSGLLKENEDLLSEAFSNLINNNFESGLFPLCFKFVVLYGWCHNTN